VAIDLGAADEAEVGQALGHQRHHVGHPRSPQRAHHVGRIAHGPQEGLRRPVPHQAQLEQGARIGRVRVARHPVGQDRQPHADEDQVAVADLAGGH